MAEKETRYFGRPSLRRAYFYSVLYTIVVLYLIFKIDLGPDTVGICRLLLLLVVLYLGFVNLKRWCTSYVITDRDVRVRSGVIARRLAIAPYQRISNVAANQNFSDRCFGLINVLIDTAGGNEKEVVFRGLTAAEARKVGGILETITHKAA
jgi:uncharacterized membrane protein YdbT with pleckstrin-like domain